MKKTILILIAILIFGCGTDQGEIKTYIYTVRNESGVSIKVLAFHRYTSKSSLPQQRALLLKSSPPLAL